MTTTGEVDEAASEDEEYEEESFEGEAIVADTPVSADDFKKVWPALPQVRTMLLRVGIIAALGVVFASTNLYLLPPQRDPADTWRWAFLVTSFVWPPLFAFGVFRGRKQWADNAVRDLRSLEGVRFRFDADGFAFEAPGRSHQFTWASLTRCLETPEFFAVYTSPAAVMVVPKRAFTVADQARLRSVLDTRVPNRPLRGTKLFAVRTLVIWVVLVVVFLAMWRFLDP